MLRMLLWALLAAFITFASVARLTSAAAAVGRAHTVEQILRDGKPVASASDVTVTPRGGKAETAIRLGETIDDGTRIDVPAHVVLVVVSSGAKSTITLEPGSSVTFVSTGSGELVSSNGGHAIFSVVPNSLDFFRVQSGEALNASVHGTVFSIDTDGGSVTFSCSRGEVNIAKTGYLLIGDKRLKASLIDVISAAQTPQATYQPSSTWYLAKFADFAQAEAFYQSQLLAAQKSGDANAVAAALTNIGIVETNQGSFAQALQSYEQARTLYQEAGSRDGAAWVINDIGYVQGRQGAYTDALQSLAQA